MQPVSALQIRQSAAMNARILFFTVVALSAAAFVRAQNTSAEEQERAITEEQVTTLVAQTCADLGRDAAATIAKINQGVAPYKDAANPALYVFVYDPEVTMVAHPRADLVGKNVKGKPDVKGKKFRDEIVTRAIAGEAGWVDYLYQKPGESGIHPKTTHFAKATGSDGKTYVVCAGKYQSKAVAK
jgi:polar amino acid transport system substrate-binding protein